MLQTRELISHQRIAARELDQSLVSGRKSIVRSNLSQIEERQRSEKYVGRLAGESTDVYRRSRTEGFVEWFGATAAEDAGRALLIGDFLRPLLTYPSQKTVFINDDFWSLDADIAGIFAEMRKAVVTCDQQRAKYMAVQAKVKIEEILRSLDLMRSF